MEEDVVGTQSILRHTAYVTCSRCGTVIEQHTAAVIPGSALDDGSEFQYLCADCQKSLADGEQDLPVDDL